MGSFGKYRYRATMRYGVWLVLCAGFCGIILSSRGSPAASAQEAEFASPPPVPLYSTGVTKTTIFGPGMIVISTRDPFGTVLNWYRTNLRDRTVDVAIDPRHHRYVTHDGASVDVLMEGSGPDAETKISLFWKSGQGIASSSAPAPAPESGRVAGVQPPAVLAEVKPPPPLAQSQLAAVTPARVEPLSPPRMMSGQAESKAPDSRGATFLKEGRYGEALLAWEEAAASGSAAAALDLGMMYDAGVGVPQSYASAFSWYEVAAENGNPVAMFNIGVLNDVGLGLRRNVAAAVDRYTQAAAKGIGRAAFNLALLYENGDGVEQDEKAAEQYFRQAERLGVRAARAHLPGRNVRPADADDSDLPFNTIHTFGNESSEKRPADAAARIERQALQGDPMALYDLAYHLEKGIGREADPRGAYMMYRQAASVAPDDRLKTAATAAAAHLAASEKIQ